MHIERRKSKRHTVPENELFAFDHDSCEKAMIKDISQTGLKVEYTPAVEKKAEWTTIDIFSRNSTLFHLFRIPSQIVFNARAPVNRRSPQNVRALISGIMFGELTREQNRKLTSLLSRLQTLPSS